MANYNFVVDSSFNPFNMQEMLVPFSAYKDAFEKSEEQYDTLSQGTDKFKYLSDTLPEGSKARQIYEGYANDLRAQAEDLAHNGLTMGNRRALTSLKRRYQGEMGRILQADEAMREEKKLRQSLGAQDTSLLYANDNLNIDDFLDGNTPNLYRISGNELYTRGAAAGKAASSRVFSAGDAGSTLNGYYRDYVQKLGYSPETIRKFYEDMSTIPELQMAADAILEERGVSQNLTGYNLRRARQSVINGMIDGAVYQENHSPQRDLGVLDAATSEQLKLSAASQGMMKIGNDYIYDPKIDPQYQKAVAVTQLKQGAGGSGSSDGGSQKYAGYDKLTYISDGGKGSKNTDEIPSRASKVHIKVKDGKYVASVGEGDNEYDLGTIDMQGNVSLNPTLNPDLFAKYFGQGESWWQADGFYYSENQDKANIKALLRDVLEVSQREGGSGYKNYNYYLEPDKASYSNSGGGFYRDPMARVAGTVSNENLGAFQAGF
nr:MAG TPA: hypothetical protein [Crassvirales sp.]